ncbi:hypothetical protein Acr_00g0008070 [Actinidia rufa]|uniref:Leucine-rich repeat protein kinase family protein n=1 Tax=Actinidia rufa TaxID=165716 RepID=A0A7J0D959_9ERIC|nr:hypothetical protein Acr_00g0008070 [Actinidia rufa]
MGKLSNMKMLSLSGNHLVGEIPSMVGNMNQLLLLGFHTNSLQGSIPLSFKNCKNLQALDLSKQTQRYHTDFLMNLSSIAIGINMLHNSLTGLLPAEVGNLKDLVILDVSYNKLSGEIPSTLGRCLSLGYLYMQENFFNGNIPSTSEVPREGVFSNASAAEVYSSIKLCGGISELRLHRCPMQGPEKPAKHTTLKLVLVIVIPALYTGLTLSLLLLYWTRKLKQKPLSTSSFGCVYKGILFSGETIVAVKVLNLHQRGAAKSFMIECQVLRKVRQRNPVKVLTSCSSIDLAEYGIGEQISTCGDVYSSAILYWRCSWDRMPDFWISNWSGMLRGTPQEIESGIHNFAKLTLPRRVTEIVEQDFITSSRLHNFAKLTLPRRVTEIVDQFLLSKEMQEAQDFITSSNDDKRTEC